MFLVLFAFLVEYNKIKNTYITFDCQSWGGTITPERVKQEREETLADIARKLKIRPFMKLGKGQEGQNHGDSDHVLAETLEAIAGAIYYDRGFDETKSVMKKWFKL